MTDPHVKTRVESDSLGSLEIPADAYYGIHTVRALANFEVSGIAMDEYPELIYGLAAVKEAAARANRELGLLSEAKAEAIVAAAREIRSGSLLDQFPIDVFQGGAGTSANMNANEVICNRALELLGRQRGEYEYLHPLDDVNMSQSTNDVYPTAIRLGIRWAAIDLIKAMEELRDAFEERGREFADVLKMGRTQLQEAVPITLGREFHSFAVMVGEDISRVGEHLELLREINLGATAVGTGLNTVPAYAEVARRHLCEITGVDLITAPDLIEATQDVGALLQFSGMLKRIAVKLSKICNDLRLLSSGPRSGFAEIRLPAVQAGSSIMPGKVNPVIPELVNQIAFEVIGNDVAVTMAAEGGQLQLNAFEPLITYKLLSGMRHLSRGCTTLARRCVNGISADPVKLKQQVDSSASVATVLTPQIGYAASAEVAKAAMLTGEKVEDLVVERGLLGIEEAKRLLSAEYVIGPHGKPR